MREAQQQKDVDGFWILEFQLREADLERFEQRFFVDLRIRRELDPRGSLA